MGLMDYTYRLKAEAGDATPHDELAVSGDLSGGTIALTDRGGGDYCWQFSGGLASVAVPSKTLVPGSTLGGITIAMTLRVSNYGATDFQYFVGVGETTPSSATDNTQCIPGVGRVLANQLRARYKGLNTSATITANTTEKTLVVKIVTNYSGVNDKIVLFYDSTSSDGGAVTAAADVVDTFWVNAVGTAELQLKDFVFWHEELSDTDCATLRDSGIRGTLDGGGGGSGIDPHIRTQSILQAAGRASSF